MIVYLDDILIYSKTKEEHFQHVKKVLEKLKGTSSVWENSLSVNSSRMKWNIWATISLHKGISVDQHKIDAMKTWPIPTNVSELRSFLGLASYYRKFVKDFSAIASPLTQLLHKDKPYLWEKDQQTAFDSLKLCLVSAPVLILPDPTKPFTVTTDASDLAIGAVLSQDQGKGDQPIAYESRKLSPAEQNYPVHEKELLAIVHAIKLWRIYLGRPKVYHHH